MLRFLNELNGIEDADEQDKEIRKQIKMLKKQPISTDIKQQIKDLYNQLYNIQYKKDYLCLIIDKVSDYKYAFEKGIYLNGEKYVRLVGTNGGVKNSTIIFIKETQYKEIYKRLNNGRDLTKLLVPAKFESYQALTCSGSIPVSNPDGVIVVNDCVVHFKSDIIQLDDENVQEPTEQLIKDTDVELMDSDGYGLLLPYQSERWTKELHQNGISSGFCIRNSWCKGMVFCYDYVAFADIIAHNHIIKDAWGVDRDITKSSMIITTSMLKLWDSYSSMEDYFKNCEDNNYVFSVTKCCPEELENERNLNYQFLQSYQLTDKEIDELIEPTVSEIKDSLGQDYRKSILFLKGMYLNNQSAINGENDIGKALMIAPEIINDGFIYSIIHRMIKKRINEAKVAVLKIHANFSIVSGDPYSLCQNMFGLKVTGLLKLGESYNKYWINCGAEKVACFRAPMTCHNNIRILKMTHDKEIDFWYQYMNTVTVFNSWDTTAHALNGCDKDSDSVFLTDNSVLLAKTRELPAIMCVQRKADKIVITPESLYKANVNSFGDEIGTTTNRITSMFDTQAKFTQNSKEYKELDYRIRCGQLYQQNAIDKTKGIIAQPMPKSWYNNDENIIQKSDSNDIRKKKIFNQSIVADRKPYFMCYIYPETMARYKKYIENTNRKSLMQFRMPLEELLKTYKKTKKQRKFVKYYYKRMPVGIDDCLINRVCWRIEKEFDGNNDNVKQNSDFDYTIYKSDVEYSKYMKNKLINIYKEYNYKLQEYSKTIKQEHIDSDDANLQYQLMKNEFHERCDKACSDERQLCNILLDICYSSQNTKQFVWDMCGQTIIKNLLKTHNNKLSYPLMTDDGDSSFGGHKFKMQECKIGDEDL